MDAACSLFARSSCCLFRHILGSDPNNPHGY